MKKMFSRAFDRAGRGEWIIPSAILAFSGLMLVLLSELLRDTGAGNPGMALLRKILMCAGFSVAIAGLLMGTVTAAAQLFRVLRKNKAKPIAAKEEKKKFLHRVCDLVTGEVWMGITMTLLLSGLTLFVIMWWVTRSIDLTNYVTVLWQVILLGVDFLLWLVGGFMMIVFCVTMLVNEGMEEIKNKRMNKEEKR